MSDAERQVDAPRPEPGAHHRIVDSDVDLHDPAQLGETRQWDIVAAAAAGGVLGAWARYGLALAVPHSTHAFPWSTVIINASGCLLIGALMVVLLELTSPHRLARPFLGVGVLGGYTTFSTFAVDAERLILADRPWVALGYVVATVVLCAAAVWLSATATMNAGRGIVGARVHRRDHRRTP